MSIIINVHEELILKNFIRSYVNVLDEINGITVTSPTRFEEAGNINYVHQIGSYFDLQFSDRLSSRSPLSSFVVYTSFSLVFHIFTLLSVDQSLCFSLLFYLIHIYHLYLPYLAIFVDFFVHVQIYHTAGDMYILVQMPSACVSVSLQALLS